MSIVLRDYQQNAINEMEKFYSAGHLHFVLAASPSSGKTITALEFIKRQKDSKFLVLTHGQNILKDMWKLEIETYLDKKEQSRVEYGLPQSLSKKQLKELVELDKEVMEKRSILNDLEMKLNTLRDKTGYSAKIIHE